MNSEAELVAINRALFPPLRKQEGVMVSGDACGSLDGLPFDLKRFLDDGLPPDRVCIRTVERVRLQLLEVEKILRGAGLGQPSLSN